MNLLIVEDDVRLASALAHILEEAGHAVDTANDGETGYAYASQGKYDVAILDVMLPKKNGFDIVSDLRRTGIATPVLMLTARDAVPDKIRGLDSGADDYMTKPFSPAELMAHLRALTRRQGEVEFETLRGIQPDPRFDRTRIHVRIILYPPFRKRIRARPGTHVECRQNRAESDHRRSRMGHHGRYRG